MTTPMKELPDGSGCFTAIVMSKEEAMALPLKERPLSYRIPSEIYHAVFGAIGEASMCWKPQPNGVFNTEQASQVAVRLCFKIAEELEKPKAEPINDSPTWAFVMEFAKQMEAKLEKNRHKGNREGWINDDIDALLERLRQEVAELDTAICEAHLRLREPANAKWIAQKVAEEAADVANFALFIADWHNERAK